MSNAPDARTMTSTCRACGHIDSVTGSMDAKDMLRRVNEAHDLLSPDCSMRYATTPERPTP